MIFSIRYKLYVGDMTKIKPEIELEIKPKAELGKNSS